MRVLYFHQHFSTPQGASGTRSYEMARRLVERGHQVTVVCGSLRTANTQLSGTFVKGRRRGMVDGFTVVEFELPYSNRDRFLKRTLTFLRFAAQTIGVALREPCDLVFATSTPLTVAVPGIAAALLRRKRLVFEVRDLWPELPRAMGVIRNRAVLWAMSALEWSAYHAAVSCIGLAPGICEGIVRRGIPSERVAMVPNGCDLDLFADQAAPPFRPLGVAADDLMAVFAGSHGIANGLYAVLDAAAELHRRGRSDIKLVLVGDGMLKPALMERARLENLDNCVFLDPIPKVQLSGLMRGADLGLMVLANVPAFYFGTSPNKFFDYLAAGMPVLNNYPGWLAQLIQEHRCGFVTAPGDARSFADALMAAADDRQALAEKGRRARRLAESQFSRPQLADQFVTILERAAQPHR